MPFACGHLLVRSRSINTRSIGGLYPSPLYLLPLWGQMKHSFAAILGTCQLDLDWTRVWIELDKKQIIFFHHFDYWVPASLIWTGQGSGLKWTRKKIFFPPFWVLDLDWTKEDWEPSIDIFRHFESLIARSGLDKRGFGAKWPRNNTLAAILSSHYSQMMPSMGTSAAPLASQARLRRD